MPASPAPTAPSPARWWDTALLGSLVLCVGLVAYHLIRWPIQAWDTDLWYHLSGGRYLFEHWALPRDTYYSFYSPAHPWVDYYWLFQALVYQIYSHWNYGGLVVFRASMYLVTWLIIIRYLLQGCRVPSAGGWLSYVAVLYGIMLLPRSILVRPHLLSYCFIATFIYMLECRPRQAWVLPLLAVLWCNFHGIYYPVLLLISLAYLLEHVWERAIGRPYDRAHAQRFVAPLVFSCLAIYVTPHGAALFPLPFTPLIYTKQTIGEFSSFSLTEAFSVYFSPRAPNYHLVVTSLLACGVTALIVAAMSRRLRLAHIVLYAGGLILWTQGARFLNECLLLTLPLLVSAYGRRPSAAVASVSSDAALKPGLAPVHLAPWARRPAVLVAMLLPLMFLTRFFSHRPRYPVSPQNLPEGVAAFMRQLPTGGTVLNFPNCGGYLRWMLFPQYRIFMNLELPPFTDTDLYGAEEAFVNQISLERLVSQYDPDFIVAPNVLPNFPRLITAFPEYQLVFFDDEEVLYANRRRVQQIAERYAINGLDPFMLAGHLTVGTSESADLDVQALRNNLPRLLEHYPDGRMTNHLAALMAARRGDYETMRRHAERIIRAFPEISVGYQLEGDAWRGGGASSQALAAYHQALRVARSDEHGPVYEAIAWTYAQQHRYREAYKALSKAVDPLSIDTPPEKLYVLSLYASWGGKSREAKAFWQFLYDFRLEPTDPLRERIRLLLKEPA